MPLIIEEVEHGATGYAAGLRTSDRVISVNDHAVRDPLEWRFHIAEEYIEIEIERDDERFIVEIEKDFDDTLGIHLKGPGFKRCNNRCIFCFVDQNPLDVRRTLRFKDEDFRLSFLYGNYVTFTNTPRADLERIVEQRLSPMYVSVHATDPDLRREILGNRRAPDILPIMEYLAEGEILQHAQIVLMPGVNDGDHLDRTVGDLARLHPWLGSICVVPVGLTRHRENLPPLRSVTPDEALALIDWQSLQHERWMREFGEHFVYVSDEFYLLAGREIPDMDFYEGFPQIGNGVGMVRQFLDAFDEGLPELKREFATEDERPLHIDLITAPLAAGFLLPAVQILNAELKHVTIVPRVVKNRWYGDSVTVTGLLAGRDIAEAARDMTGDVVLLPPNCVNDDMLFLDDLRFADVEEQIGRPVALGCYDLAESIRIARDRLRDPGIGSRRDEYEMRASDSDTPPETMRAY